MTAAPKAIWRRVGFEGWLLAIMLVLPWIPGLDTVLEGQGIRLDRQLTSIFIFAILGLGLNLQVGSAGLLQLGIAAFFAIGAYTAGVLGVAKYPFQLGFLGAITLAPILAGLAGLALGAPTLRLRGDYLAIVTLGFGEVVRVVLINLENITDGPRGLNPVPGPVLPGWLAPVDDPPGRALTLEMYFLALFLLAGLVVALRVLERSRLGRALVALREDELVSACMGMNPTRTKLLAFAGGAAIAGLAGALYATNLGTTADPNAYDFNLSIMVLCALIIGGVGSLRGVLMGSLVLVGFDSIVSPLLTRWLQGNPDAGANVMASFANWRWIIFGVALVLMMRFRPDGLFAERAGRSGGRS